MITKSRWRRGRRPTRRRRKSTATPCRRRPWTCRGPILYGAARSTRSTRCHRLVARRRSGRFPRRTCRRNRCSRLVWSAHKKKQKKTPDQHAVAGPETTKKKIHLAARDRRARRTADELPTRHTRRTRQPPALPSPRPPIFPLKYKTQTKVTSEPRTRRASGAR